MEKKPPLRTLFKIPNTAEGRAFLKQLRAYATPGTRIKARGRGPRKPYGAARYHSHLPQSLATVLGIYIDKVGYNTITDVFEKTLNAAYIQGAKDERKRRLLKVCEGCEREGCSHWAKRDGVPVPVPETFTQFFAKIRRRIRLEA